MNINKFLKSIFGDKASRDMKTIRPLVEKVKAAYPAVKALSNDELRAKTQEIRQQVRDAAKQQREEIARLKSTGYAHRPARVYLQPDRQTGEGGPRSL